MNQKKFAVFQKKKSDDLAANAQKNESAKRLKFSSKEVSSSSSKNHDLEASASLQQSSPSTNRFHFAKEPRVRTLTSYALLQIVVKDSVEVEVYGTIISIESSNDVKINFTFVLGRAKEGELIAGQYFQMSSDSVDLALNEMVRLIGRFQSEKNFQCFCIRKIEGYEEFRAAESRSLLSLNKREF